MTNTRPTIDHILNAFFAEKLLDKKGIARSRIEQVQLHLRECAEAEAHRILVTSDLVVLAAEREFHPDDAVARTMHADDLIFLLTIFTMEPWLPEDRTLRGVHLSIAGALTTRILALNLVDRYDLSCPLLDIRGAIGRERDLLWRERRGLRR